MYTAQVLPGRSTVQGDSFETTKHEKNEVIVSLKRIRDKITCNEMEKRALFDRRFIDSARFNEPLEETSIVLEVIALLVNTKDIEIKERAKACIPKVFTLIESLESPFYNVHVSIFRSFKIILLKAGNNELCDTYFNRLLSIILMKEQYPCLDAIKNEITELFCSIVEVDEKIRRVLSRKKNIKALMNPNLNTASILDKLVDRKTWKHVRMEYLFRKMERCGAKIKLRYLSCCVKLYLFSNTGNVRTMKKILCALNDLILSERESLVLVGRIVENNIRAQLFCKDINLASKVIDVFKQNEHGTSTPEFLYFLYSLMTSLEENRKTVAKNGFIPVIFTLFRMRASERTVDVVLVMIILFLKSITKSIALLKSDLLDYPIIELLISFLGDLNEGNIEGLNKILPEDELHPGFIDKEILEVLVNLVIEYDDNKNKFISSRGIERALEYSESFPEIVLEIFRNFLYNTNSDLKEVFVKTTGRGFFIRFFSIYEATKNPKIIEGCFNLIRNLLYDYSLDNIVQSYERMIESIFFYLDVFANKDGICEGSILERVLLQILYSVVNLSAGPDRFKNFVLCRKHLNNMRKASVTRNLRVAFIWVVINLSWREGSFEHRVETLCSSGVKGWLIEQQTRDPILADKIGTALNNLR